MRARGRPKMWVGTADGGAMPFCPVHCLLPANQSCKLELRAAKLHSQFVYKQFKLRSLTIS